MSQTKSIIGLLKDSMVSIFSSKLEKEQDENLDMKIIVEKAGVIKIKVPSRETGLYVKTYIKSLHIPQEKLSAFIANEKESFYEFKLRRLKNNREIKDFNILADFKLKKNEEFLLHKNRKYKDYATRRSREDGLAPPSETEILEKTSHLSALKFERPIFKPYWLFLRDDMRKVLITLAKESAHLLAASCYADKIIRLYRQKIHYQLKNRDTASAVLKQLGYAHDDINFSLKLTANNYRLALDWLIDNKDRVNAADSPRTSSRRGSILSTSFDATETVNERIDGLLEIVAYYSELDEPVSSEILRNMVWMGFDVDEAREALQKTRNNIGAACDYLAGDKSPSILELRNGLSNTSEIYKIIMNKPAIQLRMSTPGMFIFLIEILAHPNQAMGFDVFTDHGELMHHLIHIYHVEKHFIAINQFNGSQIPISALSAPQ